jgi:hypothetical protein
VRYAPCHLPSVFCHLSSASMRVAVLIFGRFLSPVKEGAMPTPCNVYPVKSDRYFTGACPACLLAKNDRIGRARLDLVNQGHVNRLGPEVHCGSGGFAPWNETCPGEHLSFGSFAIPLVQNLYHRGHVIPLGFIPWNVYPACPVGRNYHTGMESLTIPLGLAPLGTCFIKKSVEGRGNIQF